MLSKFSVLIHKIDTLFNFINFYSPKYHDLCILIS